MNDYEDVYETPPWGMGVIGGLEPYQDMPEADAHRVLEALKKQMKFIGFYENKEKPNALHDQRKTRLQKRK